MGTKIISPGATCMYSSDSQFQKMPSPSRIKPMQKCGRGQLLVSKTCFRLYLYFSALKKTSLEAEVMFAMYLSFPYALFGLSVVSLIINFPGTEYPCSFRYRMTPKALLSYGQTIAVGLSPKFKICLASFSLACSNRY